MTNIPPVMNCASVRKIPAVMDCAAVMDRATTVMDCAAAVMNRAPMMDSATVMDRAAVAAAEMAAPVMMLRRGDLWCDRQC